MKYFLATLAAFFLVFCPVKATNVDGWSNYFSYYDATDVIEVDGVLYSIMSGNLMAYDTRTTEVRHIDSILCGLSSKGIKFMGYSDSQHTLVLVYLDGNIDLYNVRTGEVHNMPHFRDNPDNDFSLNNINVQGDNALICTNEGVIAISVRDAVIKGRYPIGMTTAAIEFDGKIYAALGTGKILVVDLLDNLFDKTRWKVLAEKPVTDFCAMGDYLYIFCPYNSHTKETLDHGIWALRKGKEMVLMTGAYPTYGRCAGDRVICYGKNFVVEIKADKPLDYKRVDISTPFNCVYPSADGGYWTSLSGTGLTHYVFADNTFVADSQPVNGGGPMYEMPYFLRFEGDRLMMAVGILDPLEFDNRPFNASWLNPDTGDWEYFETPQNDGPWKHKNHNFENVTSIAQDPFDANHHFVTSARQGLFEYRNGKIVAQYTEGSPAGFIRSCSSTRSCDRVRTAGAVFDKDGNLFLANSGGSSVIDTMIWCVKRDGTRVGFYYPDICNVTHLENSLIDRKGRLWFTQRRTAGSLNGGFLCMDFNGTIDNTKDDVYTYRTKFTNQDGTAISFQQGIAIAEDRTGRIWLGTETGLYVVDNPDEWSSPDFLVTQVKVPRPDGIYADYLLSGTTVTAIAVDGADRKWIGTAGDGVYLVSSDGVVLLHHFTRANSPLVSDDIWSIACHPTNGEVFIGTSLGLMSYHSDASESEESLSRDNLRVYPNPVRPDYSGPVILDGLVYDSDVKVVSTSGHVVAAGTSVGGTFTWDGRGPSGERVGSGIYYFMLASPDGKESAVAKVAVVR